MFFKNNIFSGLLFGLLLPVVTFFMLQQIYGLLEAGGVSSVSGLSGNFRERTSAIIAIAVNLLPMRIFQNRRWSEAIRGLVIATGVLAISWVIYYGKSMIG
jgi:hypothetical protein